MVDFPISAVPLKTLLACIRLFLQTLIGVESTNDIPVQEPEQQDKKNKNGSAGVANFIAGGKRHNGRQFTPEDNLLR